MHQTVHEFTKLSKLLKCGRIPDPQQFGERLDELNGLDFGSAVSKTKDKNKLLVSEKPFYLFMFY